MRRGPRGVQGIPAGQKGVVGVEEHGRRQQLLAVEQYRLNRTRTVLQHSHGVRRAEVDP
jgi:hypothetical protein